MSKLDKKPYPVNVPLFTTGILLFVASPFIAWFITAPILKLFCKEYGCFFYLPHTFAAVILCFGLVSVALIMFSLKKVKD